MDNVVGERIRHFRQAAGWEVSKLSMESGVPEQTIRSWESRNAANPSADGLSKVAAALGVSVDALLQEDDSVELVPND